jgi:hypothetical protein
LRSKPKTVDVKLLKQFPEFLEFFSPKKANEDLDSSDHIETQTPEGSRVRSSRSRYDRASAVLGKPCDLITLVGLLSGLLSAVDAKGS